MKLHFLDHPWMDQTFYKTGSFISSDDGEAVIFCKGGEVREEKSGTDLRDVTFIKKFFTDEYLVHVPEEKLKLSLSEIRKCVRSFLPSDFTLRTEANQDEVFRQDFNRLKPLIPSALSKAVLLSREEYSSSDHELLKKNIIARAFELPQGRPYGFWHEQSGIVGCTPETLFEVRDGVLTSEALAGTAKLGHEVDLLHSAKDRGEHDFVIRDISEKLRSLDLEVSIGETVTKAFSQIIHLKTPVTANLKQPLNLMKLAARLTPTAALGGYPAKQSMNFLETMDYSKIFPDRIFGSVIGHLSSNSVALVMIRNLQWEQETFIIESGVGVVSNSELSQELTELKMKREVVRSHYL